MTGSILIALLACALALALWHARHWRSDWLAWESYWKQGNLEHYPPRMRKLVRWQLEEGKYGG